jgi:hypothetical protein
LERAAFESRPIFVATEKQGVRRTTGLPGGCLHEYTCFAEEGRSNKFIPLSWRCAWRRKQKPKKLSFHGHKSQSATGPPGGCLHEYTCLQRKASTRDHALIEQRENRSQRHESGMNLFDLIVPGCAWRRKQKPKKLSSMAASTARRQHQAKQHEWHNKSNVNATSDYYDDGKEEQVHSMY